MPIGTNVEGKMAAALRRLGFDDVFDTNLSADLTIVEEANELVERIKTGGTLPMITSCSPGWINYCEHYYPEFIPNLSTCKSPQQMFGALTKSWYADKLGIDPKNIYMFINSVYPNGQTLRPTSYPDNIAGWLVALIQRADTPTNVFPSMGDCAKVCPEQAIWVQNGLAHVDPRACIGCGLCAKTCPQKIIELIPAVNKVRVRCSNTEPGAKTRKACSTGCIGCKKCEKECPVGAITVEGNLSRIDNTKCTVCGKCVEVCPTGALIIEHIVVPTAE